MRALHAVLAAALVPAATASADGAALPSAVRNRGRHEDGVRDGRPGLGANEVCPGLSRRGSHFTPLQEIIHEASLRIRRAGPAQTSLQTLLRIRGGVKRATPKATEKGAGGADGAGGAAAAAAPAPAGGSIVRQMKSGYQKIPLATRSYITLAGFLTFADLLLGSVTDVAQLCALDWRKSFKNFQLWRPLTGCAFLGKLNMSWATQLFFLYRYGMYMEAERGAAEQLLFFVFCVVMLNLLSAATGFPYMGQSLVVALIYVSSRVHPMDSVPVQFGLTVPSWLVPYTMAAVDVLQAQSQNMGAAALIPHIIGIIVGHSWHFFSVVYPLMGGRRWLGAPEWLKRRVDGGGSDYMQPPSDKKPAPKGRKAKSSASKAKKVGKGVSSGERKAKIGAAAAKGEKDES